MERLNQIDKMIVRTFLWSSRELVGKVCTIELTGRRTQAAHEGSTPFRYSDVCEFFVGRLANDAENQTKLFMLFHCTENKYQKTNKPMCLTKNQLR
jgi:hypothetical protein